MTTNPSVTSVAGSMQRAQLRASTDAAHLDSMTGKILKVWGLISILGPGEALLDVLFPVLFTELPAVSSSFHLADGEVVESGNFPVINVGVKAWNFDQKLGKTRFYKGAELLIVATGHADMRATAHWQLEGRAVVPPVFTDTLAEDTV